MIPKLADKIYDILESSIGASTSEWLRWSFGYAVNNVHVDEYTLDSEMRAVARITKLRKGVPVIILLTENVSSVEIKAVAQANMRLKNLYRQKISVDSVMSQADTILSSEKIAA